MKKFLRRLNVEGRAPARPRPGGNPALQLVLFLLCIALGPLTRATELADLGQGLGYLRVESLEAAIKPLAGNNALVLDLRRTTATPEAISAFSSLLAARPADARLFVLVSPATPPALAGVVQGPLVTLGIKGSQPPPQVVVGQSAEADRQAYDAYPGGISLADLISGKIEKERFDEASLVLEFKHGHPNAEPPAPAPDGKEANEADRPTDRVLQRAVHLHRVLLALKR